MLFDLQIFSGGVYPPSATSRTISFSISNSFLVLIWFIFSMRRRTVQPEIRSFVSCFDPLSRHLTEANEEWELFRRAQRFWQRKVWTQRPSRGEKLIIIRCKFLARKSTKFFANFSATKVTSLSSHSLSLSLSLSLYLSFSLSPSAPHAQYRKRFRASYKI